VETTFLSDTRIELPRVHPEAETKPYRYVYGVGTRVPGHFTDQLVKVDVQTGAAQAWHAPGCYPGEPVFVPAPNGGGRRADGGVLLSVVLDAEAKASFLLVLDAATLAEVARATVPHVIPHGFHGQFFG
jgi:carotenoid cleavage dioxygenase-like enzyme